MDCDGVSGRGLVLGLGEHIDTVLEQLTNLHSSNLVPSTKRILQLSVESYFSALNIYIRKERSIGILKRPTYYYQHRGRSNWRILELLRNLLISSHKETHS